MREVRHLARQEGVGVLAALRASKDPTTRTVLYEDSVALVGVIVAGSPEDRERIHAAIERTPGIVRVIEVLTVYVSPGHIIVAGYVVTAPDLSGPDMAMRIEDAETAVRAAVSEVSKIFLEAEIPSP